MRLKKQQHISAICALGKVSNRRINFSLSNTFEKATKKYNAFLYTKGTYIL